MKNDKRIFGLVMIAVISSIAVVLNFIEIPYIVPYLKIEISDVMVMLGLSFGFPVAVAIALIKAFIKFITGSSTFGVGEITMFIGSMSFITTYYFARFKFSKKVSLVLMSIVFSIVMVTLNYFVITPLYYPQSFSELRGASGVINGIEVNYLEYIIIVYLPFNLLKAGIVSVCYYFISERLDKVLGNYEN